MAEQSWWSAVEGTCENGVHDREMSDGKEETGSED